MQIHLNNRECKSKFYFWVCHRTRTRGCPTHQSRIRSQFRRVCEFLRSQSCFRSAVSNCPHPSKLTIASPYLIAKQHILFSNTSERCRRPKSNPDACPSNSCSAEFLRLEIPTCPLEELLFSTHFCLFESDHIVDEDNELTHAVRDDATDEQYKEFSLCFLFYALDALCALCALCALYARSFLEESSKKPRTPLLEKPIMLFWKRFES